jgi:hypothetical protein
MPTSWANAEMLRKRATEIGTKRRRDFIGTDVLCGKSGEVEESRVSPCRVEKQEG